MANSSNFRPYTETTVDGIIDAGRTLDLSQSTITVCENVEDTVIMPFYTLLSRYHDALKNYIREVTFTDDEYIKYYMQPKLYSYEKYGTPELAYSLLYINNMPSMMDFKKKTIKIFSDNIMDIINELLALNEKDMTANRKMVSDLQASEG